MPHLHEDKIKFLEDKKGQEVKDSIFRKMSADEKIRLWGDFTIFGLKRGLPDGTEIPMVYLTRWLKNNEIISNVL